MNLRIAMAILGGRCMSRRGIDRPPAEPPEVVSLSTDDCAGYEVYTRQILVDEPSVRPELTCMQRYRSTIQASAAWRTDVFSVEGVPASDAQVSIKEVNGRTAMGLLGLAVGGLGWARTGRAGRHFLKHGWIDWAATRSPMES